MMKGLIAILMTSFMSQALYGTKLIVLIGAASYWNAGAPYRPEMQPPDTVIHMVDPLKPQYEDEVMPASGEITAYLKGLNQENRFFQMTGAEYASSVAWDDSLEQVVVVSYEGEQSFAEEQFNSLPERTLFIYRIDYGRIPTRLLHDIPDADWGKIKQISSPLRQGAVLNARSLSDENFKSNLAENIQLYNAAADVAAQFHASKSSRSELITLLYEDLRNHMKELDQRLWGWSRKSGMSLHELIARDEGHTGYAVGLSKNLAHYKIVKTTGDQLAKYGIPMLVDTIFDTSHSKLPIAVGINKWTKYWASSAAGPMKWSLQKAKSGYKGFWGNECTSNNFHSFAHRWQISENYPVVLQRWNQQGSPEDLLFCFRSNFLWGIITNMVQPHPFAKMSVSDRIKKAWAADIFLSKYSKYPFSSHKRHFIGEWQGEADPTRKHLVDEFYKYLMTRQSNIVLLGQLSLKLKVHDEQTKKKTPFVDILQEIIVQAIDLYFRLFLLEPEPDHGFEVKQVAFRAKVLAENPLALANVSIEDFIFARLEEMNGGPFAGTVTVDNMFDKIYNTGAILYNRTRIAGEEEMPLRSD